MEPAGPVDRSALSALAPLPSRAVLRLGGTDRVPFLQGLVSNDVTLVGPGQAVWAALLTPQGKYLHDFGIAALDEALLLDVEADRRDDLIRRLKVYRLRAKVTIEDVSAEWAVAAVPDPAVVLAAVVEEGDAGQTTHGRRDGGERRALRAQPERRQHHEPRPGKLRLSGGRLGFVDGGGAIPRRHPDAVVRRFG